MRGSEQTVAAGLCGMRRFEVLASDVGGVADLEEPSETHGVDRRQNEGGPDIGVLATARLSRHEINTTPCLGLVELEAICYASAYGGWIKA